MKHFFELKEEKEGLRRQTLLDNIKSKIFYGFENYDKKTNQAK